MDFEAHDRAIIEDQDAEIARLTAERDEARAQLAAVIERAADEVHDWSPYNWDSEPIAGDIMADIRALTSDDATAALNQMLNEAYQAGQRDMRERAAHLIECDGDALGGKSGAAKAIRALPIKERNE